MFAFRQRQEFSVRRHIRPGAVSSYTVVSVPFLWMWVKWELKPNLSCILYRGKFKDDYCLNSHCTNIHNELMKQGDKFTFTYECKVKLCCPTLKKGAVINYIQI